MLNVMFGIAACAAVIVAIVLFIVDAAKSKKESYGEPVNRPVKKGPSLIALLAAVVLTVLSGCFVIIPTGYSGVRATFGQIDRATLHPGFNVKIPFAQTIELVNNKQQDIRFDGLVWSETKERTAIYYDAITVTYQINPENSAWIYANVANYRDSLINQSIVASAIKSSSKSLSDVDATNRAVIEPLVMENLDKSLVQKYGQDVVTIVKVIIGNADFDDSYNEAIAARQQAQLESEKQAIENQKAIDKAAADAKVRKTNAEAEAEAKLISAQAEAEANRILEKSLSDPVLREMWIEKWDGKLPQYLAGEEASVMIGIDSKDVE